MAAGCMKKTIVFCVKINAFFTRRKPLFLSGRRKNVFTVAKTLVFFRDVASDKCLPPKNVFTRCMTLWPKPLFFLGDETLLDEDGSS